MPDPVIPPTSEEDGLNPDGTPKVKGTPPKPEDAPKFTQADLDRVAANTRAEEKAKALKTKEKEEKDRLEAEAKEQGEFQKLADSKQKELDELKPKYEAMEAELTELKPAFAALIDAELKTLPEEVVESGPAKFDDAKALINPSEVAAWLPKGKALAAKLEGQPATPGMKRDPKATGAPGDGKADELARRKGRQAYRY